MWNILWPLLGMPREPMLRGMMNTADRTRQLKKARAKTLTLTRTHIHMAAHATHFTERTPGMLVVLGASDSGCGERGRTLEGESSRFRREGMDRDRVSHYPSPALQALHVCSFPLVNS